MEVKNTLKNELDTIIGDLIGKIDTDQTELSVNDILDLAIKQKAFNENAYVFSNNEDTLMEMLVFNLALSRLWANYKNEAPDADITELNQVLLTYMRHMWGLDIIEVGNKVEEQ